MRPCLEITERRIDPVTIIELSGRLIIDEGDRVLRDRVDSLVRAGHRQLLVDLRNVTYIDSCGVGVLVSKYLTVTRNGGQFKLVCPSGRACRVLEIAGLLRIFEVYETEDTALRSFRGAAAII